MPRIARDVFDASFFHVIVQGINKEFIFKEERFINQYLKLIRKHIDNFNVEIIAYCIMGNHAHFLLKTDSIEEISKVMHKTNGMYAKYYNFINERVGYVFRDRFLSEPIMNQRYFIQCIKYTIDTDFCLYSKRFWGQVKSPSRIIRLTAILFCIITTYLPKPTTYRKTVDLILQA